MTDSMQLYQSSPLPIAFWYRFGLRLDAEFRMQEDVLAGLLLPRDATVDSTVRVLARVAGDRLAAQECLAYLENIQLLKLEVGQQHDRVSEELGIPDLARRITALQQLVQVYTTHLGALGSRLPAEHDLDHVASQYSALRSAGHSEALTAERQRLQAVSRSIQVMGSEDTPPYLELAYTLQTSKDQLEAELQRLRGGTNLFITVPAPLALVLQHFGVASSPVAPADG